MKNEIAVSEYDMIGAELYYCYNYFENRNKINKQLNKINDNIQQNSLKGNEYSTKNIKKNPNIDWSKYPEIQEGCQKYCESKLIDSKNKLDIINTKKKDSKTDLLYTFIFLFVGIILLLLGFSLFSLKVVSYGIGQIISGVGLFIGGISIYVLIKRFKSGGDKNVKKEFESLNKNQHNATIDYNYYESQLSCTDFSKDLTDSAIFKEYLKQLSNEEAATIFHNNEQKLLSDLEEDKTKTKQYLLSKINENKIVLNSLKDEFESNMSSRTTIIPSVYHNEEDIKNLIDYYVRRRGDTWKELVNEYEHDKKLNQIISSLDNLSNQVNILTNGVIQCFSIIGQQLGIINQSINSLQNATALNLDKISEIENQQERRLCELTSSIQSMNKQTKVIIESK